MADRLERLKARIKDLPDRPGVYLHKNAEGDVIYVGKARNLRNRVGSYVVGKGDRDPFGNALVKEIEGIDFVTTNNELEAILLENNLIKAHQPRYNVLLRDDKTYPYIKVTMSEDFPRVVFTRRLDRKKGDLFYGPFFAGTARRLLKLVADQFKLRSCDLTIVDGKSALPRPCLYYDMHQCLGPCVVGLTTREQYLEMVDDVVLFLGGKSKELQDRLSRRMYRAAGRESCWRSGCRRRRGGGSACGCRSGGGASTGWSWPRATRGCRMSRASGSRSRTVCRSQPCDSARFSARRARSTASNRSTSRTS